MKKDVLISLLTVIFLYSILFTINAQDITGETITGELTSANLAVSIPIVGPPILTIIKPENETYLTTKNLLLNYSALGADFVWYNFDNTPPNKTITTPIYFNTTEGSHTLYLYANNTYENVSENVTFTVNSTKFKIYYNKWKNSNSGISTNFNESSYEDIQNLSGIILEHIQHGKITFNQTINLTNDENPDDNEVNLSAHINISENRIKINITGLPNFNKSATLQLYNLTLNAPVRILRDGSVCSSAICTQQSYTGGTLIFNGTQFTVYSAESVPGGPVTPPGGGAGISARLIENFSIDTEILNIRIVVGDIKTTEIEIKNTGQIKETISLTIEPEKFNKTIILDKDSLTLNPLEKESLKIKIIAPNESGIYTGKIILKTRHVTKEILITINTRSKEILFDVSVVVLEDKIYRGDKFKSQINLIPVGDKGLNVSLRYLIKDFKGKTHYEETEILYIDKQESFVKEFNTNWLTAGDYILGVELTYSGHSGGFATASDQFEILSPLKYFKLPYVFLFLIVIAIIILILIIRDIKKYKKIAKYKIAKNKYKVRENAKK